MQATTSQQAGERTHTPGLWIADSVSIYRDHNKGRIMRIDTHPDRMSEHAANMALIASAPELLQMLEVLANGEEGQSADQWYCPYCDRHAEKDQVTGKLTGKPTEHREDCHLIAARAAIIKATTF